MGEQKGYFANEGVSEFLFLHFDPQLKLTETDRTNAEAYDLSDQARNGNSRDISIQSHNEQSSTTTTTIIEETSSRQSDHSSNAALQNQKALAYDSQDVFQVTINLPHPPHELQIVASFQEQAQDLKQSIMESPGGLEYSCFHLEYQNRRINDFVELSEVKGFGAGAEVKLIQDPYTEKEARMHLMRIREIIGVASERNDTLFGIAAGVSLHDAICSSKGSEATSTARISSVSMSESSTQNSLTGYTFNGPPNLRVLTQSPQDPPSKTIKSLGLSAWNPPPPYFRHQGHLMYLQLTTNEGEQFQITSHLTGFFVSKSSNSKFDPFPRPAPKDASAHSLLSLISKLSSSFDISFRALLEANNKRDPLVNFQLTNAVPACPWLVPQSATSTTQHSSDFTRIQETYLMSGLDGNETMRDWNEELQSTKELPRETVQERVFRERLLSKIYAEFTDAAARGAVLVARGEVNPLNPTEAKDAQIFVYNNIFYSFGADGVGTFTSEGGDEAARVAVGKDATGVKIVNQLDVAGLSTAGTVVVDYLGQRIVAQSIVPGIFKQREPDEHQVDYGGVEGRDVVADNEIFVSTFSQVSKYLKLKRHPVWDKEGKRHDLESSVETKGLLGTDGRKYILDLYRLTPLDISWLEKHCKNLTQTGNGFKDGDYPHRLATLRPELIDSYWRLKMGEYVKEQVEKNQDASNENASIATSVERKSLNSSDVSKKKGDSPGVCTKNIKGNPFDKSATNSNPTGEHENQERVDLSEFSLVLNPDVFCGQIPQTDEEKAEWAKDECEVRAVCDHLHHSVFPELLSDLRESEVGFPMDGVSLSRLLHKRGINMRYLGKVASIADDDARGYALKALAEQEMISRAFKHEAFRYLDNLPMVFSTSCIAHLLNCILGTGLNKSPVAVVDEGLQALYPDANFSFLQLTPGTLLAEIKSQVQLRYRYSLQESWIDRLNCIQMLRSISLKLGLQLVQKDYLFASSSSAPFVPDNSVIRVEEQHSVLNGHVLPNGSNKKKKKGSPNGQSQALSESSKLDTSHTFHPDDIANIVPLLKGSCPKSALAEEALEAGKLSMMQSQKEIGQDLLLESLSLHEQIYGVLHPEVARVYHQLATLYFQLDEKLAAIELAHKAVIISERTLGIDSSETILSYLNLALFEHGNRNTETALACVRHALDLWNIIYGHKHPDFMTTLNNAAVMLQQLHKYHESKTWFEESLSLSEEISGKSSINTGTLLFQLAQALVLDGEHKGAVYRMREAYSIFRSKLGPEDINTKESEKWLEQLTQNAVSMAKHAKDMQTKRIRRVLFDPRATNFASTQPQVGQAPSGLVNGGEARVSTGGVGLDSRSIDELMKFIDGGGDISKSSTAKKRPTRGHPRRRGGASIRTQA